MAEGRHDELGCVCSAIAQCRPVVVCGPAGIGKSTLVDAVVAAHPRARVGQSLPSLTHRSHHPWLHAFGWPGDPGGSLAVAAAVRAAGEQCDLVVLEDLQWADPGTLEVVAELAGARAMVLTLQLGSTSAEGVLRLVDSLGGATVALGPLPAPAIAAAVRTARPDLLDGEVDRVVGAAGGNPLIAKVLAASTDGAPDGEARGHSRILAAVLSRHPPAARRTLFALGAAPGPLPADQLEEVGPLERSGLVRRTEDERCELTNQIFAAPELLELGHSDRRVVLERLVALDDIGPQQRAAYLLAAGRPAQAMEDALAASRGPISRADQASALLTAAMAAKELHAAGALADEELEPLLIDASRALNDSARFTDAGEVLGDHRMSGGPQQLAALVERLRTAVGTGDRRLAARLVEEQGETIDRAEGMDGARARTLRTMLTPSDTSGAELRELAEAQLDAAANGAQRAEAAVVAGLSTYAVDIDESVAWFRAAREDASAAGALAAELDATRNLVFVQISLGHHEDGQELARAAAAKAADAGERSWAIEFRTLEVLSSFYSGRDHDEAMAWLSYVRTAPVRLETRALVTAALATLLADRGAVRRSAEVLAPWMEEDQLERLGPFPQAFLAWGAVQRSWMVGELAETIRIARWVTDTVPPGYPSVAGTQVVWRWAEYESGMALSAPDPVGGLLDSASLEAMGIEMLAAGRPAEAVEAFLEAEGSWAAILWRCALRCRWAAGHALCAAGDLPAARSLLESVDADLDRSGLPALRPRVMASLRSTVRGSTPASPRPRSAVGLTSQEERVLLLVVEGLTSNEIARRLGVATSTVDSHVRAAKQKLGARTRIEAASMVGLTTR